MPDKYCRTRKPYPLGQHILCVLPLLVMLCLFLGLFPSESEVAVFFSEYRKTHPYLTYSMKIVTNWGNAVFYPVYAFLFWQGIRHKNAELRNFAIGYAVAQLSITFFLGSLCKVFIGKPRPLTGGDFIPLSLKSANHSFPSGHTTEILCSSIPLSQRYGNIILPLALGCIAALMGFSRIYLNMHYPSDILGSVFLGSAGAYVAWFFCHHLMSFRRVHEVMVK